MNTDYETLVLSGGSFKCIASIGCIKYLEEVGIMKNIKNFIGTSAGSILNLFYILGYTSKEISNFFVNILDNNDLFEFDIEKCIDLFQTYGLNDGDIIVKLVQLILKQDDMTFKELYEKTNKNMIITVSNLSKRNYEYFSYETNPNMSIIVAIKASCTIPILFTPVIINNEYYVDGGLYNNFPIGHSIVIPEKTIGISFKNKTTKIESFSDYIKSIINEFIIYDDAKINDINIFNIYLENIDWISFSEIKINFTKKDIERYIDDGYKIIRNKLASQKV